MGYEREKMLIIDFSILLLDLLVVMVRRTGFKWPKGQHTVLHSCLEPSNGNCNKFCLVLLLGKSSE